MILSILFATLTAANTPIESIPEKKIVPPVEETVQTPVQEQHKKIEPFTGKVIGSKVRLRLQPSLDGLILKELSQGDLLVITDETDDFYAVIPEKTMKGFIYRAYVLDNVVEANNVNLRIDADTQSPIITQLNQGAKINGTIYPKNNKWLVVDLPETIRFYVAKDYVNKAGDVSYFHRIVTKREHAKTRFVELQEEIASELKKPFPNICITSHVNELKTLAEQNQDLPEYSEKALALAQSTQDEYLQLSQSYQSTHKTPSQPTKEKSSQVAFVAPQNQQSQENKPLHTQISFPLEQQEAKLLARAIEAGNVTTKEAFYAEEMRASDELIGQLIPYTRAVKNRPGDFMLVDDKTKVPLAYLYSSRVDLGAYVGQTIKMTGARRPNNDFALPAYFVLEVQVLKSK